MRNREVCLRDIEDVSQANLTFLSFKVLNFVSLKLGKFKFRTLEVMKLGVFIERGRASKMGNLTGPAQ